jgi:hypothetical protein
MVMRLSKPLRIRVLCIPAWGGWVEDALAQGTKDPSFLGPTMTFPIRPRNEPGARR